MVWMQNPMVKNTVRSKRRNFQPKILDLAAVTCWWYAFQEDLKVILQLCFSKTEVPSTLFKPAKFICHEKCIPLQKTRENGPVLPVTWRQRRLRSGCRGEALALEQAVFSAGWKDQIDGIELWQPEPSTHSHLSADMESVLAPQQDGD